MNYINKTWDYLKVFFFLYLISAKKPKTKTKTLASNVLAESDGFVATSKKSSENLFPAFYFCFSFDFCRRKINIVFALNFYSINWSFISPDDFLSTKVSWRDIKCCSKLSNMTITVKKTNECHICRLNCVMLIIFVR